MKPFHEMSIAEAQEMATRRELNRRMGRPLDAPAMATGLLVGPSAAPRQEVTTMAHPIFAPRALPIVPAPVPALVWPLRLTLPWSELVSDNERTTVSGGRIHLTKPYRAARKAIRKRALEVMAGALPVAIPLRLEARVWVPDDRPHDTCNFAKGVHDALEKHVYAVDRWLYDTRWLRAGVDVDAPRAEITITPLPEAA